MDTHKPLAQAVPYSTVTSPNPIPTKILFEDGFAALISYLPLVLLIVVDPTPSEYYMNVNEVEILYFSMTRWC